MRHTVKDAWTRGETRRASLLRRARRYAAYTIPVICPPDGYDEQVEEMQTDYQAVGALAVNGLANRLILALFAPSRPFMRYDVPAGVSQALGVSAADLQEYLSDAERRSVKLLDQLSTRPRLYEAVRNLIVTGNCLLILGKDKATPLRVLGLNQYTVKRSMSGKVVEVIVKQTLCFDELDTAAQQYLRQGGPGLAKYARMDPSDPRTCGQVDWFTWVRLEESGKYTVTSYVDEHELPSDFNGTYAEQDLPYRPLTWELPDGRHYGVGLVEQCSGDFAALSTLSEAQLRAAVLASEFRWLCNPGGMTQPEDLESSENGAAIPGVEGDVVALSAAGAGVATGLQIMDAVLTQYVNRIGRTFLLGSSVVRDAERVTAEEIRMQAQELETSLGGVYSRLAIDFQLPLAYWLASMLGVKLSGTAVRPTIITGLDALSRNADLDNLTLCIADLAQLQAVLQGPLGVVLNVTAIVSAIFAGRGVAASLYVNPPDVQQQLSDQQHQQAMEQAAAGPAARAATAGADNENEDSA